MFTITMSDQNKRMFASKKQSTLPSTNYKLQAESVQSNRFQDKKTLSGRRTLSPRIKLKS
jgi:hypothetical protein